MKKYYFLLLAFLVIQFSGFANETVSSTAKSEDACATLTLTSGADNQTVCVNTPITNISYVVGNGGTGVVISAGTLPPGVTTTYNAAAQVFTISGTPTVAGLFNIEISTVGGDCPATLTAVITVNPFSTVSLATAPATTNQVVCVNTPIAPINYIIGSGGTGATITGLPAGITGVFNAGVMTIIGASPVTGTYNYTISTSGGCWFASSTGVITIIPETSLTLTAPIAVLDQTVCLGSPITMVTFAVENGGTGATITGLPSGVNGVFVDGNFTIIGTPSVVGTFNYTVMTSGGCGSAFTNGTITVSDEADLNFECGSATSNSLTFDWNALPGVTGYNYSYVIGSGPVVTGTVTGVSNFTVSGVSAGQSVTFTIGTINGVIPCFSSQSITCNLQPLANQQFGKASFSHYPNPVHDILNLENDSQFQSIAIYDMVGKKVLETKANENKLQVDLSGIQKGLYMVTATTAEGNHTFKIIKD